MIYSFCSLSNFTDLKSFVASLDDHFFYEGRQIAVTNRANCPPNESFKDGLVSSGIRTFEEWKENELSRSFLSPFFQGTAIESALMELKRRVPFKLGRVRLMRLHGGQCYSFHQDLDIRLQIPIITNEESLFFVGRQKIYHLPADGRCFIFDARVPHTAINGHLHNTRTHMVCSLVADKRCEYSNFIEKLEMDEAPAPYNLAKVHRDSMEELFPENLY